MRVPALCLTLLSLLAGAGCRHAERPPLEVSAVALHSAFLEDPSAARDSFRDRELVISGEVVRATPRFEGTTMSGTRMVEPVIYFRTELDTLPGDIKYVVVEGLFDDLRAPEAFSLDPRIHEGGTARVRCPGSTLRWTDPGLYLENCDLAMP